jgi:HSP20 family protein
MLPLTRDLLAEDPANLWARIMPKNGDRNWDWTPCFDVIETPGAYIFKAELPGMDAENLDVTLTGDLLTIKGDKKKEDTHETDHYRITERTFGTFQRSFNLPGPVNADSLEAELSNGVLEIRLMKTNEGKPNKIKVKAH